MKSAGFGIRDYVVVAAVVMVLGLLFTPVSPLVLDILLIANIALALTVLLVTFQTEKPLDFSTFPSVLLLSTLLRLALNISATRLILEHGYAGDVIEGIGSYVVGGNYVTGIVVFFILVVIQYVVVTNGAQRVAEVAARFTLDSMPGKQMSIDADLNMGLIGQDEARARRANIEREANFYGAMDGASKFVKGDAIAGILIILINIIGGLAIGIAQKGMGWGEAMHRYTLLTIGDGIVTQIPSLVIAVATGIIVTRATTDQHLGQEIVRQLFSQHRPLLLVAGALLLSLTLVSIPTLPVLVMVAVLGSAAFLAWRSQRHADAQAAPDGLEEDAGTITANINARAHDMPAVALVLGPALSQQLNAPASALEVRLESVRETVARELGFPLPKIVVRNEPAQAANDYVVRIAGSRAGHYTLYPGQWLAIAGNRAGSPLEGIATREPTYGIAAVWISGAQRTAARAGGHTVVEAERVLYTHLTELLRKHAGEMLSRKTVEALVEDKRAALGSLVDELVPVVLSWSDIQRVLQLLLAEQVSIVNLEHILEVLVDRGRHTKSAEELAELVRERLGMALADRLLDDSGALHVVSLAPSLERRLLPGTEPGQALSPAESERLFAATHALVESRLAGNVHPVILCVPALRRTLRRLFARTLPHIPVLSLNEVANATRLVAGGTITLDGTPDHGTAAVTRLAEATHEAPAHA